MNAGIDFLEFRPSEIAAAVAICVSRQMQALDIDKAITCFIHVEKVKSVVPTERNPGQDRSAFAKKFFPFLSFFQLDELI